MKLIKQLNEMRKRDDGSKEDMELRIEQLADAMEMAGSEGEQEEIHTEIERLSRKIAQGK